MIKRNSSNLPLYYNKTDESHYKFLFIGGNTKGKWEYKTIRRKSEIHLFLRIFILTMFTHRIAMAARGFSVLCGVIFYDRAHAVDL